MNVQAGGEYDASQPRKLASLLGGDFDARLGAPIKRKRTRPDLYFSSDGAKHIIAADNAAQIARCAQGMGHQELSIPSLVANAMLSQSLARVSKLFQEEFDSHCG